MNNSVPIDEDHWVTSYHFIPLGLKFQIFIVRKCSALIKYHNWEKLENNKNLLEEHFLDYTILVIMNHISGNEIKYIVNQNLISRLLNLVNFLS